MNRRMNTWSGRFWRVWAFALVLTLGLALNSDSSFVARAQGETIPWAAWTTKDISTIGDDNSGSSVAMADNVTTPAGDASLMVTPGGRADETKLAFPVTGADLAAFAEYGTFVLEVYLPESNTLNPNRFFVGMGDNTTVWSWVGGSFGVPSGSGPGWITVRYALEPAMRAIDPAHTYILYLSFFHETANQAKRPLTEPFYLGSATLIEPNLAEADADSAVTPGLPRDAASYQAEVDMLLSLDDDALLEAVARETFDFFWEQADPDTGLIVDRNVRNIPSSIASTGFGLAAIPIGIDRGWISFEQGYERVETTLRTFLEGGVQGEEGFFFHFVNMRTGQRMWESEVSTIDTTLLVAGAIVAGEYFAGTEVADLAEQLYERMNWDWATPDGQMVSMGWRPETGFINATWDHFDESMLLYVLGIGAPTDPLPVETWDRWNRPVRLNGEYIYLPGEPLFVYQYPLAFLNLRNREDAYANYWNNTVRACERNRQFAIDNAEHFLTYRDGVWGISASDGPNGYRAYGASSANHDGTIAPYASIACLPFTPEASIESMRAMLRRYGAQVWREYGFVSAINENENWYSTEHIGIDQGDLLLMITNYQDGLVWDLFMQNEHIQAALDRMGFVESTGDYAVTPAYLALVRVR